MNVYLICWRIEPSFTGKNYVGFVLAEDGAVIDGHISSSVQHLRQDMRARCCPPDAQIHDYVDMSITSQPLLDQLGLVAMGDGTHRRKFEFLTPAAAFAREMEAKMLRE